MKNKKVISKMNFWGSQKKPFMFIIDFDLKKPLVIPLDKVNESNIKFSFNNISNTKIIDFDKNPEIEVLLPSFGEYLKSFNKVKENLLLGNSYLVNLTFESEIKINLSLEEIFHLSEAKYKFMFKDKFTFFSPETFIKIKNRKIFSYPMKGTIDADIKDAEQLLLNDEKELAEHYTIVDLIRNDLNIVAKNVCVNKFRYIDYIKTSRRNILQMSSEISGDLPENYHEQIGDIIFKLLPAGSISGAPKDKTVQIIKEAENYKRGYYTGIAGVFDGENVDSCVIIRYIEKRKDKYFYKSGGGITYKSFAQKEYEELESKIYMPILKK